MRAVTSRDTAVLLHGDMLRAVTKLGEKFRPRAGHPGLGVERADLVE
jgi:hypothetical protein